MNWQRSKTPTGVPVYEAGPWRIEGDVRFSTHSGMVFGNYVNEAGRESKVVGWRLFHNGRMVQGARKLADLKARAERGQNEEREHEGA